MQIPPELFVVGAALRDPQQQPPATVRETLQTINQDYSQLRQRAAQARRLAQAHMRSEQAAGTGAAPSGGAALKECGEIEAALQRAQTAVAQLLDKLSEVRQSSSGLGEERGGGRMTKRYGEYRMLQRVQRVQSGTQWYKAVQRL